MRESWFKDLVRSVFFRPGAVRRIRWGPLKGMVFRVGPVTGMAPWYSGAERAHQKAFARWLRSGMVAVDVGANWGLHTLYFSRLVGLAGRVIAIEPYPPAFAELKWHIATNRCENVLALRLALSEASSDGLFVVGQHAQAGRLMDDVQNHSEGQEILKVVTRTLDGLVEEHGLERLDLVKVDVEGGESRVLRGAERVVAKFHPIFVIDLHTPEQDVFVARWLTERGYSLERLSGPPIVRSDLGWPHPEGVWGSIVARPV